MAQKTSIRKLQAGAPKGGTTGQVLVKNSNTDFDYDWASPPTPTITDHSFVDNTLFGGNAVTVHYKQCGKLYFGFCIRSASGNSLIGNSTGVVAPIHDTFDHFAIQIGVTINTYYPIDNADAIANYAVQQMSAPNQLGVACFSGGVWTATGGATDNIGLGFLAN